MRLVTRLPAVMLNWLALALAPMAQAHGIAIAELELRPARPADFLRPWIVGNRAGETRLRPV